MAPIVRISEMASLAIHGLALIAAHGGGTMNVREMAGATGASEAHLAKTMQRLAKAGLVFSERGPKGGFALARPAEDITLLEIYEAVEGPRSLSQCPLGRTTCTFERCLFGGMLESVEDQVYTYLADHSLTDVAFLK